MGFIFLLPSSRASRKMSRWPRLAHKEPIMLATASRHDEENPDWLPKCERWAYLARSGFPSRWPYNVSFIDLPFFR